MFKNDHNVRVGESACMCVRMLVRNVKILEETHSTSIKPRVTARPWTCNVDCREMHR